MVDDDDANGLVTGLEDDDDDGEVTDGTDGDINAVLQSGHLCFEDEEVKVTQEDNQRKWYKKIPF